MEFLDCGWNGQGYDCGYLPLVHLDTSCINDIAQELDGGLMELTFLEFEEEIVLSKLLEETMFSLILRANQDVINVEHHK